jgi:hypothetical protein
VGLVGLAVKLGQVVSAVYQGIAGIQVLQARKVNHQASLNIKLKALLQAGNQLMVIYYGIPQLK